MPTITSLGSGSGLDLEGIVNKLMAVERLPLTALAQKGASFQAKLSAYGSLKSTLSTLQISAQALAKKDTFTGTSVAISDETALSATSTSSAASGSYTIKIGQLAQGQSLRSNTNFATTTETFNTGNLAISVGGATAIDIAITSSNNTLEGIRDAINTADAGVSASIVSDGTTNRLLLSSKTTGLTAGAVSIIATDAGSGGTNALSILDSSNLFSLQPPLDAHFNVNGLDITRSSNKASDVISGVTLNLTKAGTLTEPLSSQLTISRDDKATQTAITGFVNAYNAAIKQIRAYTNYNAEAESASILTGDSTLRSIQTRLSGLISTNVSGLAGNISRMSNIGIAVQKDGTLLLDTAKLESALGSNSVDVSSLFGSTTTGNEGIAVRFNTALEGLIGSSGLIASRTDGINRSIKSIAKQSDALDVRLTSIEQLYRAKFSALDRAVSSMQGTSTYLTQQLASIAALNKQ
jgi:flagellar hook-associated protein 2